VSTPVTMSRATLAIAAATMISTMATRILGRNAMTSLISWLTGLAVPNKRDLQGHQQKEVGYEFLDDAGGGRRSIG
jgi:hypothetical protein